MSLGGGGGTQPVKRLPEQTASAGAAGAEPTTGTLQRSRPCQCHRPSRGKASILPSKCPLFFFFFFTPLSPSPFPRPLILSTEPLDRHCVPGSPLPTSGETTRGGGGGCLGSSLPTYTPGSSSFFPPLQPSPAVPSRTALPQLPPPPPGCWTPTPGGLVVGLGGDESSPSYGKRPAGSSGESANTPPSPPPKPEREFSSRSAEPEVLGKAQGEGEHPPSQIRGCFSFGGTLSAPSLICPSRCSRL